MLQNNTEDRAILHLQALEPFQLWCSEDFQHILVLHQWKCIPHSHSRSHTQTHTQTHGSPKNYGKWVGGPKAFSHLQFSISIAERSYISIAFM